MFVRLITGGTYFISHSDGWQWSPGNISADLINEFHNNQDEILDLSVAGDGSWIVIQPHSVNSVLLLLIAKTSLHGWNTPAETGLSL